jgi:holin-like protein
MIVAITVLLLCQLAGEGLARAFALPIPGPVLGLVFLFVLLVLRGRLRPHSLPVAETPLGVLCAFLLANLSLLFVPAGVGIIGQTDVLARHGAGLLVALVGYTAISLVVTALVFVFVAKRLAQRTGGGAES